MNNYLIVTSNCKYCEPMAMILRSIHVDFEKLNYNSNIAKALIGSYNLMRVIREFPFFVQIDDGKVINTVGGYVADKKKLRELVMR